MIASFQSISGRKSYTTEAVAHNHLGFVLLQSSEYPAAVTELRESQKLIEKHFLYLDYMVQTYTFLIEALLGPRWCDGESRENIRLARKLERKTTFFGWRFPNYRSHAWRVGGRLAAARGKKTLARKCFHRAIRWAEHQKAPYFQALALLDRPPSIPTTKLDGWHRESSCSRQSEPSCPGQKLGSWVVSMTNRWWLPSLIWRRGKKKTGRSLRSWRKPSEPARGTSQLEYL